MNEEIRKFPFEKKIILILKYHLCSEAPEEVLEQKVWQPAKSKAPIRRVRSVTFDESSLFNLHDPQVTSKKSCAPFIPTSRPLKPIIKNKNFLNC